MSCFLRLHDITVSSQEVLQLLIRECGYVDLDVGQQHGALRAFAFHVAVFVEPGFDEVVYFGRKGHELVFADEVAAVQSTCRRTKK